MIIVVGQRGVDISQPEVVLSCDFISGLSQHLMPDDDILHSDAVAGYPRFAADYVTSDFNVSIQRLGVQLILPLIGQNREVLSYQQILESIYPHLLMDVNKTCLPHKRTLGRVCRAVQKMILLTVYLLGPARVLR